MRIRFSVILSAGILAIVMVEAQGIGTRHIPFGKAFPIIEQLRPGDRVVTLDSPKIGDGLEKQPGSVDEALNELMIMPEVVVFRVQRSESYLVENGTWVRTRVSAQVENAVRHSASIPWGDAPNQLILDAEDGEIQLKGVTVKAGRYPILVPGSRYLGLLAYDGNNKSWYLGIGYAIDRNNKLQRLNNWDGTAHSFESPLEGLPLETVIDRLKR